MSDSHGELENLEKAVEHLTKKEKVEMIIHLGDDSDDAKIIEKFGVKVIKVPGVFESYYQDPNIPNRLLEDFNGWKVLLTHTDVSHKNDLPTDLKPEKLVAEKTVEIVLHGHTHIPRIEEKEEVLFINPGHLKKEDKKGYPPSFAVIEFEKEKLTVKLIGLDGKEIQAKSYQRKGKTQPST